MKGSFLIICKTYSFITLHIVPPGVPRIPMNLTLSTKEGNVLVGWIRNFDGGLKQTFFIEFRESNSKKWTVVQSLNMTEGDMLSWTIERLQTKTTYNFRMFAQNRLGRSNSTKEKSIIVGSKCTSLLLFFNLFHDCQKYNKRNPLSIIKKIRFSVNINNTAINI